VGSGYLDLKKVIASSCRQNILKALSKGEEINVMELVIKTNSTYNEVNRNLIALEKEDLITTSYCGRMRLIKLNKKNPKTTILIQVLKTLETENGAIPPF